MRKRRGLRTESQRPTLINQVISHGVSEFYFCCISRDCDVAFALELKDLYLLFISLSSSYVDSLVRFKVKFKR